MEPMMPTADQATPKADELELVPEKPPEVRPRTAAEEDQMARVTAQRRAEACGREIERLLQQFRCRIVSFLQHEPVGQDGGAVLTRASFGIVPL